MRLTPSEPIFNDHKTFQKISYGNCFLLNFEFFCQKTKSPNSRHSECRYPILNLEENEDFDFETELMARASAKTSQQFPSPLLSCRESVGGRRETMLGGAGGMES
ncbi:hypothetical protein TNCV_5135481 [Trichonephila clavipes]|nr:hypothetical protein TNCV_5135481 [Trichonephila clavipes]